MSRDRNRQALLQAGREILGERGFNHAGLDVILKTAGVPKGSFYHFFPSKEAFGIQVVDEFAEWVDGEIDRHLGDRSLPPGERLKRLSRMFAEHVESRGCRCGCLVGNLSQELADQNEAFRQRLDSIFRGWTRRYAACLQEAKDAGEIAADLDPEALAEFWLSAWQGAVLRAKTAKDPAPLRTFLDVMFGQILKI